MKNAFLVHSTGGSPFETFYPWLSRELKKLGYAVQCPQFPTPEGQTLGNWMRVAKPYLKGFNEETILVGRSIGGPFVLRLLEASPVKINAAFIVAGFCSGPILPQFQPVVQSFIDKPFDWKKIRANAKSFFVYHSDNDPYLPLEMGEKVAKNLGIELTLVPGAGHFGLTAGFTEFPLLLDDVKSVS
ncbi:MAG: alpha/beta hydrolase [Candidatus Norongarragalinales archaeon]